MCYAWGAQTFYTYCSHYHIDVAHYYKNDAGWRCHPKATCREPTVVLYQAAKSSKIAAYCPVCGPLLTQQETLQGHLSESTTRVQADLAHRPRVPAGVSYYGGTFTPSDVTQQRQATNSQKRKWRKELEEVNKKLRQLPPNSYTGHTRYAPNAKGVKWQPQQQQ